MSYLNAIRASISSLFTPSSKPHHDLTQRKERDRKLMPPPSITRPLKLDRNARELTPTTKTSEWLSRGLLTPMSSHSSHSRGSLTPDRDRTSTSSIRSTPSPGRNDYRVTKKVQNKRARSSSAGLGNYQPDSDDDGYSDDELEGPTLVGKETPAGKNQKGKRAVVYAPEDTEDSQEQKQYLIKRTTKNEVAAENSVERGRHLAETLKLPEDQQWSEPEKDLFKHLAMRGFEPIFPKEWSRDFNTFPDPLFADREQTLIHNKQGTMFRGSSFSCNQTFISTP